MIRTINEIIKMYVYISLGVVMGLLIGVGGYKTFAANFPIWLHFGIILSVPIVFLLILGIVYENIFGRKDVSRKEQEK